MLKLLAINEIINEMKLLIPTIVSLCMLIQVNGQSLTPWVMGGTGGFFADSVQSISWTVGEVATQTFSDSSFYLTQGFQQPWFSTMADTQYIQLELSWSMFSTYLVPADASVPAVMAPVVSDIVLMKDGHGFIYWPLHGVNTIGNFKVGEGYNVKMYQPRELEVIGTPIVPELATIYIPINWCILGYLRNTPAPIETMLASINSNIMLLKNSAGYAYWPIFGLNQIGNLDPGQGYLMKSSAVTALVYPPNSQAYAKSMVDNPDCVHFPKVGRSEHNLTLGIPLQAWDNPPSAGDEIAVYSTSGVLAGSSVFIHEMHSMPVWGDDPHTHEIEGLQDDEAFYLILWRNAKHTEEKVWIEEWKEGSGFYKSNNLCVASKVNQSSEQIFTERGLLCKNYPNPFKEHTKFEFFVPHDSKVKIEIFSLLGESVEVVFEQQCREGSHEFEYNNSGLAQGTYIYKVSTSDQSLTQYLSIMK